MNADVRVPWDLTFLQSCRHLRQGQGERTYLSCITKTYKNWGSFLCPTKLICCLLYVRAWSFECRKLALQISLGLVTPWACSFFNISKLPFLNQASGDNCSDLKSCIKDQVIWFIALYNKATTPSSHIFMNLGQSVANKKGAHSGGFCWPSSL